MENVRVPKENLLGEPGQGFKIAMSGLDGGRLNIGACSLGGGQSALEKAIEYMGERQAFGTELTGFQALRFEVAEMQTKLEAARSLLWRAANAYDAGDPNTSLLSAMAKLTATDSGFDVANRALQLHGGYGYLTEYGIEKLVRDLRVHQILEGTNEIMRVIISRKSTGVADMTTDTSTILTSDAGGLGRIELNRPKLINALSLDMVAGIDDALRGWYDDDGVAFVLVTGRGDRGLCAGGDIKAVYTDIVDGSDENARFWNREYRMNAAIAEYPKPYVVVMNGITMGGGVGISAHGSHRIVTDSTKVGMPETGIGLFPDVGGTYLLARAPGELGTHLALTGTAVGPGAAIALGLADHYVPEDDIADLITDLESGGDLETVIARYAAEPPENELAERPPGSTSATGATTPRRSSQPWPPMTVPEANAAAELILTKAPTSVKVTLAACAAPRRRPCRRCSSRTTASPSR